MSKAHGSEADAAISLIREAMATLKTLNRTPRERLATDGIATVLEDVIRPIEALGGGDGA